MWSNFEIKLNIILVLSDDEKVRFWMRSKDVNNGCKAVEILKKYDRTNFNASSTEVLLDCSSKEASVICSIDKPKYLTPQKPFSRFPCTKNLSTRRDKRSEPRLSKTQKDRGINMWNHILLT